MNFEKIYISIFMMPTVNAIKLLNMNSVRFYKGILGQVGHHIYL